MLQDRYIHIFENNSKRQNQCNNCKFRKSVPRDLIYGCFYKGKQKFSESSQSFHLPVLLVITINISLKYPYTHLSATSVRSTTLTCVRNPNQHIFSLNKSKMTTKKNYTNHIQLYKFLKPLILWHLREMFI